MDPFLTVPCPTCGRNVVFPPEKRSEPTKCRGCNFEFIPSLPPSITSIYTPVPMGPPKPPLQRDPTEPLQKAHRVYLLGCPAEVWLVIAFLGFNAYVSIENCIVRTISKGPIPPESLMEKFYGNTLAAWLNFMAALGVADLVLAYGLFSRSEWGFYLTIFRFAGATLLSAAMLINSDFAPIGVAFPILMMMLSLSRAAGRY
jgi:hypothetical protein